MVILFAIEAEYDEELLPRELVVEPTPGGGGGKGPNPLAMGRRDP